MKSGRISIWFLTFMTYAIVHMMRTTYSFNKHSIQKIFGIGDLFIGFVDAFIYLTLAIGTFLRYSIINYQKPVKACLVTAIPTAIGFCIVPVIALFHGEDSIEESQLQLVIQILMILGFGLFGFFQLTFFPSTLTIFGNSFSVKNDGRIVGIWSSKSNAGNILGFFMANFLVYHLEIKWEYTMIICSILLVVICFLMYKFVDNPDFKDEPKVSSTEFFRYFKKTWSRTQFKLYILSFSIFMAVLYSYELWTPKFLSDLGYKTISGYVPMIFDGSTLFGSFLMGHIYKKQSRISDGDKISSHVQFLNRYKLFIPSVLVVMVCFCYLLIPGSLGIYFVLGSIMGLFLGAIYNSLQNNQVLNYTQNQPSKTDMFSTINIGIGCSTVGLSQFIIGFILHLGQSQEQIQNEQKQSNLIYLVIGIIAIAASLVTLARACYKRRSSIQNPEECITESKSKSLLSDQIEYDTTQHGSIKQIISK